MQSACWSFVSTTLGSLVLFAAINGAANGGFFATMLTVVGNVFGSQRVSVVMGMIVTASAEGYLMGSPIPRQQIHPGQDLEMAESYRLMENIGCNIRTGHSG
ncbi:hypothetical protein QQS21_007940 [Conoideocrella luteorostrata]|uniref:Uncharacterized protein n=1 Tax=Conoideocrella luteorostrata TaxID=1105319 RepID=A0AAJ0CJX1_9HYPO|nr:hypothetical protein QQS21_007940 [Conoideocrella luteorostrata]